MYNPAGSYAAYCHDCWWGDAWNPLDFGLEYDFNKTFFEQYTELLKKTPLLTLSNLNSINSEYGNFTDNNKGCYLVFGSGFSENVRYTRMANWVKDSQDLLNIGKSELMYECVNSFDSYGLKYSLNCKNCTDSYFLYNCRNCNECFGCINLVSKSNCIFNKQYTKEQYEELIPKIIKHMNNMPYIDSKKRIYKYGEFFPAELSCFYYNETIAQEYLPLTKEEALEQSYKWKDREKRNYAIDIRNENIPDSIKEVY